MGFELNLNQIGETENLLRTLDFWQEIESRLMNSKDGMLVIGHFPKKDNNDKYKQIAEQITDKSIPREITSVNPDDELEKQL